MQRHILAILLLSVFIALLGIGIIVPVMPVFAASLGASGMSLGLIIAAFSISRGFFQPIVGSLSDRWGRKGFLLAGLLVYTLVGLILPRATSITNLIIIRVFHGVGSAMIVPVAMACVGGLAPVGREGRYMGFLNIAIFMGIGGGPLLGGFFTDLWGMAAAFYAMAALSCTALLLVLFRLPAIPEGKISGTPVGILNALAVMLADRRTAGILLARMSTMMIMVPTMGFLPLLMAQWFQSSGMEIGMVIACRTLINAAMQTPCGRLADRYDKVRLLQLGCLVISIAMCLVPLCMNFWSLLALFIFLGMGESVIWPALGAFATEEGRRYGQGTMMGAFSLAMSTGVFLGSLGAGSIMDIFGLGWSFVIIGIVVLGSSRLAASLIKSGTRGIASSGRT
jgi:DHA1 family multidrug resistance protein-like MFS transporter